MSFNRSNEPFDPSKKFTIFGSWMSNFDMIAENAGVYAAYRLFQAIADYSMYGFEPDFSDIDDTTVRLALRSTFLAMAPNIDKSRRNSKANFGGGERNERELMVIHFRNEHPEATIREIAEKTGVSKSAVDRLLKKNPPVPEATTGGAGPEAQRPPDQPGEDSFIEDDPDDLPF